MQSVAKSRSQKFKDAGKNLRFRGIYFPEEVYAQGHALLQAKRGDTKLFWIIDPDRECIVSAKYFTYGGADSLAVAEAMTTMVQGLPVMEAFELSGEEIERSLRDDPDTPSAPMELFVSVDELIDAARGEYPGALASYRALNVVKPERSSVFGVEVDEAAEDQWLSLPKDDQLQKLNEALDGPVRDGLIADGGGMEIIDIKDGKDVYVSFQGACATCASSTGATLLAIEDTWRREVYARLNVIAPGMW